MKEVFKKVMAAALTMTVLCGGLPAVSGVSTSLITAVTANAEVYSGIEVAGVEITSENADDILGDGVFSYDPLQETITIAGDYTNKELEYDYYTGESLIRATVNCTVVIAEDSVVTIPNGTFIYSSADVTIEGPGSLVLNCVSVYDNHTTGALSIIDADIDIRAGFGDGKGSGIIGGCAYVQSDQKKKCKSSFEEQLEKNGRLIYTNKGDSMMPLIKQDRDLVVIEPVHDRLKKYDVPLYKRDNGKHILHRVLKVRRDDYVMCGDNRWAKEYGIQDRHIIGILTAVIRNGKEIKVTDTKYRLYVHLWCDLFPVRAFIVHVISKIRRIML